MFILLYLSAISACLMLGIVWASQIAVYPAFAKVEASNKKFFDQYMKRGGFLWAAYMAFELTMAIIVLFYAYQAKAYLWISLGLLCAIWLVSWAYVAPTLHGFKKSHPADKIKQLTRMNWIRTACWTARVVLLTLCVYCNM
ncbi:MAG: hypothetical protein S4CHLAM102_15640 [Chlamydiia bacterium]|nr:hypothetical protein [Chlamydiia bacterium]